MSDSLTTCSAADMSQIFGPQSTLGHPDPVSDPLGTMVSQTIVYKLMLIATLVYYCYVIFAFRSQIRLLFKLMFATNFTERFEEEQSYLFSIFIKHMFPLGIITCALILVRTMDIFVPNYMIFPQWVSYCAVPATVVLILTLLSVQFGVSDLLGRLTLHEGITNSNRNLKKWTLSMSAIVQIPLLSTFGLYYGTSQMIFVYISVFVAIISIAYYFSRSFSLFISQKVSILLWILYLCTVELVPVIFLFVQFFRGV